MCAIIDAEHAFDSAYEKKLGVDVDNLLISQPDYGEQGLEIADRLILSGARWMSQFQDDGFRRLRRCVSAQHQSHIEVGTHQIGMQPQARRLLVAMHTLIDSQALLVIIVCHQAVITFHCQPERNKARYDNDCRTSHQKPRPALLVPGLILTT